MKEQVADWMTKLRTAFTKAVSEDDMRAIAQGLVEKAKRGDERALKLLMTYLEPPPPAQIPELPAPRVSAKTVHVHVGRGRAGRKSVKPLGELPHHSDQGAGKKAL